MYGKRRNPNVDAMNEEIQEKFGILINWRSLGEILNLKSPTAVNRWVQEHGLPQSGRKGYYYSLDVAKAIVENGGVA